MFWLSPVNYVVGANQDIFEWIKLDIAKELLSKYLIDSKEAKFSKSLLWQTYIYNNSQAIISTLLTRIGNTLTKKKTGVDVLDSFESQIKSYQEFEKHIRSEEQSDYFKLSKYISDSTQIKGSIFEEDLMTILIRMSIELVKLKEKKECILVIDDLDRLDPEHIFRILNILSANNNHFDSSKFNFQKTVLVCDIENIKHLYQYRYGPESDFEGYIEKFYTYEPFHFTIISAIINFCGSNAIVNNIDENNRRLLSLLIISFFEARVLKIRNIRKIFSMQVSKSLPTNTYKTISANFKENRYAIVNQFMANDNVAIDYNSYDFLKVVYILSIAFGGINELRKGVAALIKNNAGIDPIYKESIIHSLAIISHIGRTINQSDSIAFFSHKISNYHSRYEVELKQAKLNFIGVQIDLPLIWTVDNQYKSGDFFKYLPHILINKLDDAFPRTMSNYLNWNNIGNEILKVIDLIKREHFFENTY